MRTVALDCWAFLEVAFDGPRRGDIERLPREADFAFTAREVVAECFSFIVRRTKRTEEARRWWSRLFESGLRVFEPPLEDVRECMERSPRVGSLTFTDYVLAFAATREHTRDVATENHDFGRLGLVPLFAGRRR